MLVVGLQGSPRRKGNSRFLLETFLDAAASFGAETRMIEVDRCNIVPCKEYTVCEKRGTCPIDDDMLREFYGLIRRADLVVAATPVFFYNMTAQLKAVIDRCQVFWSCKYRLRRRDPRYRVKKGYLLAVAATRGPTLFDAIHLTMKYWCDALDAGYAGHLTYRGIEGPKDMSRHPTVREDVMRAVAGLIKPLADRRKLMIIGPSGARASQMAAALLRAKAADRYDVRVAGREPAEAGDPAAIDIMAARGWDIAYERPSAIADALAGWRPDTTILMGRDVSLPDGVNGGEVVRWDVPAGDPVGPEGWAALYDRIEDQAAGLTR